MTDLSSQSDFPTSEGAYDAQLSFGLPYAEAPSPIARIVKRDGREAPFDVRKIADAIFKAAQSLGGDDRDRAESLATGVTIYFVKDLQGATPNVEQVHDAVEKVLIEMGHARTALAYARYRDKRARMRKLRTGDVRAIIDELEQAQYEHRTLEATLRSPLFVRTSDDRLATWDRARIVQALVREARVPEERARMVAVDVENQIRSAGLKTLTTALVRELVDACLVTHGLGAYRARHMRLGVPLYDAEQIICTPNQGEHEGQQDPGSTDIALARRVKREFALAHVHSAEVTDAHLRGDIHVHDLAQIDRLHSAAHSLHALRRFGLAMYSGGRHAPPPVTTDALVAQASRFTNALRHHFARGIRWTHVDDALATLSPAATVRDIEREARLSLFGFSTFEGAANASTSCVELDLDWSGACPGARALQLEFVRTWVEAIDSDRSFGLPCLRIALDSSGLADDTFRRLLSTVLATPQRRRRAQLLFARKAAASTEANWRATDILLGEVTINAPRVVATAPNDAAIVEALAATARLAVDALLEKKIFMQRLFAFGSVGPVSALTFRHGDVAYCDIESAAALVSITGLFECAQLITGEELHVSPAARDAARRLIENVRDAAERYGAERGVRVLIGAEDGDRCARRFALLDLNDAPDALRRLVKPEPVTRDATYTPGVSCEGPLTPMERLRYEGALHAALTAPPATAIALSESEIAPDSIVRLLEKALIQTTAAGVRFP